MEIYKVILKKGLFSEEVKVDYEPNWLGIADGVNHIELHGKATSETGYRSHFFFPDQLESRTIEEYIKGLVSELSGCQVESVSLNS